MPFHEELQRQTAAERGWLLAAPVLGDALAGRVGLAQYVHFLQQAYHHVKHTVPLLMACGARLPDRHAVLRRAIIEYIEEEAGHEEWILDDIVACGGNRDLARDSTPGLEAELMVAHAYDWIARSNPVGFFGMVFVLEGTSVSLALDAASRIQGTLALPDRAFSYLRSHGTLDREHTEHLAGIVRRLEAPADRNAVTDCADAMFWLYGNVFRSLERTAYRAAA